MEQQEVAGLKEDIVKKYEMAQSLFEDVPKEDKETLQMFSFIGLLSYDVYIKKLLIEKMVDSFTVTAKRNEPEPKEGKGREKKETKNKEK